MTALHEDNETHLPVLLKLLIYSLINILFLFCFVQKNVFCGGVVSVQLSGNSRKLLVPGKEKVLHKNYCKMANNLVYIVVLSSEILFVLS